MRTVYKRKLQTLSLLIMSGCASTYQPKGFSGGYTDVEVGQNKYLVTFQGNGFTDEDKVQGFAMKRAKEMCVEKGFKNFELLSKQQKTEAINASTTYNCQNANDFSGGVSCKESSGSQTKKEKVELLVACRA